MWFCQFCGQDLCDLCYATLPPLSQANTSPCPITHSQDSFLPISFLLKRELDDVLHQMRLLDLNPTPLVPPNNPLWQVQRFQLGQLTGDRFAELWAACEPFVVVGVTEPATPHQLLDLHTNSHHPCKSTFYDAGKWTEDPQDTLENYFATWDGVEESWSWQIRVSHSSAPHAVNLT